MKIQPRQDVYQQITDRIVAALESGVRPWMQPWNSGHAAGPVCRPLRHNLQPYSGINVLILWSAAAERGYEAPIWMTFTQAKDYGGKVRKGEHGERVVYANTITKTERDEETGEEEERQVPMLKTYTVFNVEQIDGLPERFYATTQAEALDPAERIEHAEAFFVATGTTIKHCGGSACYSVTADEVRMPAFERFKSAEDYYATLAHEMTHGIRHPSRLARDFGRQRWGAHNKVMIIDGKNVITGSFNFTKSAQTRNAENVLLIQSAPELAAAYMSDWEWRKGLSKRYQGLIGAN